MRTKTSAPARRKRIAENLEPEEDTIGFDDFGVEEDMEGFISLHEISDSEVANLKAYSARTTVSGTVHRKPQRTCDYVRGRKRAKGKRPKKSKK